MNKEDYDKYYQQGGSYVIPVEIFNELFEDYECFKNDCKKYKEVFDKLRECVENEMPYLQETDKEYEDVNGNTYFTYKEYDGKELIEILKEVE